MNKETQDSIPSIPSTTTQEARETWGALLDILRYLRTEQGCPWDKEQTVPSLRPHIIEESSELLDAIAHHLNDPNEHTQSLLEEEMGDLLLVLTMMMVIHEDHTRIPIERIIATLNQKLIRRHPHVFEDVQIENADQLLQQWNTIKREKEGKQPTSFKEYKNYMHVLERTKDIQKKLAKEQGLFTQTIDSKIDEICNQIQSLKSLQNTMPENPYTPTPDKIEQALGELLFSFIDIMRSFKVSPTSALTRTLTEIIQQYDS